MAGSEISRGDFLRLGAGLAVGFALGKYVTVPLSRAVVSATESVTSTQSGNAGLQEKIKKACGDSPNEEKCTRQYLTSELSQFGAVMIAPPVEESLFRAIPSLVTSALGGRGEKSIDDMFYGTGRLSLSRREVITGAISTILFGAVHNITDNGFDTNTIPASQVVVGGILWYLQRVFGLGSNIIAHAMTNYEALSAISMAVSVGRQTPR